MLAPITHIVPLAVVERKRVLPCDGRVLAQVGSQVEATDIIAEGIINTKHIILDLAQSMNMSAHRVMSLMKVKKGQRVSEGQVLVEMTGIFSREVVAPVSGRVVALGGGKLVLEFGGTALEMTAGMPGIVKEILGERGVVIRSTGSVIQGVWGNGKFETGTMMSLLEHADEAFDPSRLDLSLRGSIILGGYVEDAGVFNQVNELPVKGLILTSMSPALIPVALEASYPIILLEGFGNQLLNSSSYKLLSTNVRRVISLNAVKFDRFQGEFPEVFIPLPVSQEPPGLRRVEIFQSGQTVKIVSLLRSSQMGVLRRLIPGPDRLPNGLRVKTAEVQLENGELVIVPLTNLQMVG